MRRHEARRMLRRICSTWPGLRLGPGDAERWEFDLALHDFHDVAEAIDDHAGAGAPPPASTVDLFGDPPRPVSASMESPAGEILEQSELSEATDAR